MSAWQLGDDPQLDGESLRRWAHQFGYGGHCFTKSRRYSTTFKALREARADHAAVHSAPVSDRPAKVTTT